MRTTTTLDTRLVTTTITMAMLLITMMIMVKMTMIIRSSNSLHTTTHVHSNWNQPHDRTAVNRPVVCCTDQALEWSPHPGCKNEWSVPQAVPSFSTDLSDNISAGTETTFAWLCDYTFLGFDAPMDLIKLDINDSNTGMSLRVVTCTETVLSLVWPAFVIIKRRVIY